MPLNLSKSQTTGLTLALCLKIFDSKLKTRLRTDGSSVGLDAFLEQNYGTVDDEKWYAIDYSFENLLDYGKCYAKKLEKETHSIVLKVESFHGYLYGCRFTEINDHKTLKSVSIDQ